MNAWIKTNTLDLVTRRGKKNMPTKVDIMLSPYDVPNAVRTCHENNTIVVEFRYINIIESRSNYQGDDDGVSFEIGDKTQRIYKIFLDPQKMNSCEINFSLAHNNIDSAIEKFISHQESMDMNTTKYTATRSVLVDHADSLQASI